MNEEKQTKEAEQLLDECKDLLEKVSSYSVISTIDHMRRVTEECSLEAWELFDRIEKHQMKEQHTDDQVKVWNVFDAARYDNGKLIEHVDRRYMSDFWLMVEKDDYDQLKAKVQEDE